MGVWVICWVRLFVDNMELLANVPILVAVVVIMVGVIHVRPTFSSDMSSFFAIITGYVFSI